LKGDLLRLVLKHPMRRLEYLLLTNVGKFDKMRLQQNIKEKLRKGHLIGLGNRNEETKAYS
jgi:hypothetical protein